MALERYSVMFTRAFCLAAVMALVSTGHTFFLQTCYSKALKVMFGCQPWLAVKPSDHALDQCMRRFPDIYLGEQVKSYSYGLLWSREGGTSSAHFSILNPAFVDAVVIALPANLLLLTFLLMHLLAIEPIRKLPELGAIATLLMLVSSGCCFKAIAIGNNASSSLAIDIQEANKEFVKVRGVGVSFIAFQVISSVTAATLVIIIWSGHAFHDNLSSNQSSDLEGEVRLNSEDGDGAIPLEDISERSHRAETSDSDGQSVAEGNANPEQSAITQREEDIENDEDGALETTPILANSETVEANL